MRAPKVRSHGSAWLRCIDPTWSRGEQVHSALVSRTARIRDLKRDPWPQFVTIFVSFSYATKTESGADDSWEFGFFIFGIDTHLDTMPIGKATHWGWWGVAAWCTDQPTSNGGPLERTHKLPWCNVMITVSQKSVVGNSAVQGSILGRLERCSKFWQVWSIAHSKLSHGLSVPQLPSYHGHEVSSRRWFRKYIVDASESFEDVASKVRIHIQESFPNYSNSRDDLLSISTHRS